MLGTDSASPTHPAKRDRIAAITKGWTDSCDKDANCRGIAKAPIARTESAKNTPQCPAGQVFKADKQGGIVRGEGYCVPCHNPPAGWTAIYPDQCGYQSK